MYEQAVLILSATYFIIGLFTGLMTALVTKTRIKKLGCAFIGGVVASTAGLIVVTTITGIQSKVGNTQYGGGGISLYELLPSLLAAVVAAIFFVYVIGLVAGKSRE
jgi:hypothetical protein